MLFQVRQLSLHPLPLSLAKTIELEKEAIDTMKEHGLVINQVPPDSLEKWRAVSSKGMNELIGNAFSKEISRIISK